jgi:NADH:ubiquinone oxidoreductase subunit 3 (subunit A)
VSAAVFIAIMVGAVLIGVIVTVTSEITFTRKSGHEEHRDYEGGFWSGFDPRAKD